MIIRNEMRIFDETYLRTRISDPSKCLFFDIETTGLRADRSHLYLICLAVKSGSSWKVTQLFGEKPTEEAAILRTFAQMLRPYEQVVTFNGEMFDIGYLAQKYEAYGLPSPLADMESIDLYRDLRTLRHFLQMPHMNQKSLERWLGLDREDLYDGGQLIPVYRDYVKTGSEELLNLLLLHNFEDVCGMFKVTELYAYRQALDLEPQRPEAKVVPLSPEEIRLEGLPAVLPAAKNSAPMQSSGTTGFADIAEHLRMTISFPLEQRIPVPVTRAAKHLPVTVTLRDRLCEIRISALKGRFLYFLEPYKDYYYLPEEDEAIHKDVAVYTDKKHRVKATAATCYTHQDGIFLPQPSPHFTPVLKRGYRDPLLWFRKPEDFSDRQEQLSEYCMMLLNIVQ